MNKKVFVDRVVPSLRRGNLDKSFFWLNEISKHSNKSVQLAIGKIAVYIVEGAPFSIEEISYLGEQVLTICGFRIENSGLSEEESKNRFLAQFKESFRKLKGELSLMKLFIFFAILIYSLNEYKPDIIIKINGEWAISPQNGLIQAMEQFIQEEK